MDNITLKEVVDFCNMKKCYECKLHFKYTCYLQLFNSHNWDVEYISALIQEDKNERT